MTTTTLYIAPDGTLRFVYRDDARALLDTGAASIARASHVEPSGTNGEWTADMSPIAAACTKCAVIKPLSDFDMRDGGRRRRRQCRACRLAASSAGRRAHYKAHPDAHQRAKARNRVDRVRRVAALKLATLRAYAVGPEVRCACCGEPEIKFLTIDHARGDGAAHRRHLAATENVKPGSDFYRWLARHGYPAGYRVLCFNCNCARGLYGTCPHESGGPVLGPFPTRQAALDAEVAWLAAHLGGGTAE